MTTASKLHKHYNMLIDIAFWSFLIQSIIPWLRHLGLSNFRSEGIWDIISFIVFYSTFLLLVVLVASSALRDEYAQSLWNKTAARIAKILAIAPLPLYTILFFMVGLNEAELSQIAPENTYLGHASDARLGGAAHQLLALAKACFMIGIYYPFAFVSLYKWQRWRDG
ncbi:MAG: hypothetical protein ABL882_12250 [Sphingopyxis sp.]